MDAHEYIGRHRLSDAWGYRGIGHHGCIDCENGDLHTYCRLHPAAIRVNMHEPKS